MIKKRRRRSAAWLHNLEPQCMGLPLVADCVEKLEDVKPTVIADLFRPVGAGDRIDDGSAAG